MGVIITALTEGAVFDITGGILTAIGVKFASVTLGWQRNKLLRIFKKEIRKGQRLLETDVKEKLDKYILSIKAKMETIFGDLDAYLEKEDAQLNELRELNRRINIRLQ